MSDDPRARDLAHVGPVELLTPTLEASRDFFVDQLALEEVTRQGDSVYLHTWDDYQRFTVKLTADEQAGIGRVYLRAAGPDALQRRIAVLEAGSHVGAWVEDEPGIGPIYLLQDPDGHEVGIYWETERYQPGPDTRPALKNQAARYPGRGANVRRLDHVNYLAADVSAVGDFMISGLGAMPTEQIVKDDGSPDAIWYTVSDKTYDVVYTRDWTNSRGRLHHIAFACDTREEILRAADVCLEAGIHIETGPHKHAIQQTFFLYVWEPGGNRIELCNAGARLMLAPDWQTISWTAEERSRGQAWGLKTIESFHTHGTPPIDLD